MNTFRRLIHIPPAMVAWISYILTNVLWGIVLLLPVIRIFCYQFTSFGIEYSWVIPLHIGCFLASAALNADMRKNRICKSLFLNGCAPITVLSLIVICTAISAVVTAQIVLSSAAVLAIVFGCNTWFPLPKKASGAETEQEVNLSEDLEPEAADCERSKKRRFKKCIRYFIPLCLIPIFVVTIHYGLLDGFIVQEAAYVPEYHTLRLQEIDTDSLKRWDFADYDERMQIFNGIAQAERNRIGCADISITPAQLESGYLSERYHAVYDKEAQAILVDAKLLAEGSVLDIAKAVAYGLYIYHDIHNVLPYGYTDPLTSEMRASNYSIILKREYRRLLS